MAQDVSQNLPINTANEESNQETVNDDEPTTKLEAIRRLADLSDNDEVIQLIIDGGMLPKLFDDLLLHDDAEQDMQYELLRILINISSGTNERIEAIVNAGALPPLSRFLPNCRSEYLCNAALSVLDNVAKGCVQFRNQVINLDFLPCLENLIKPDTTLQFFRTLSRFICNICSYRTSQISMGTINQVLPTMRRLLSFQDPDIVTNIMSAVWNLSPAVSGSQFFVESDMVSSMIQLLEHEDKKVVGAVMNAFTSLTAGGHDQIQVILNCGLLDKFFRLNEKDNNLDKNWMLCVLTNIARGPATIQAIIGANLIRYIVIMSRKHKEGVSAISNMVWNGTLEQISYLAGQGAIAPLIKFLGSEDLQDNDMMLITSTVNRIIESNGQFFVDLDA